MALVALGFGYYLLTGMDRQLRQVVGWVLLGYGMLLLWLLMRGVAGNLSTAGLVIHIVLMMLGLIAGYYLLRRRSNQEESA